MSLLESFAETGALLTIATTHHSELKTLKYRYLIFKLKDGMVVVTLSNSSHLLFLV